MVADFTAWKQAVSDERKKLIDVYFYLNAAGMRRERRFGALENIACFCESAKEMLEVIRTQKDLEPYEIEAVQSDDAQAAIRALRIIAELEDAAPAKHDETSEMKEPNFWVTFKLDARYSVGVNAENAQQAIPAATEKYYDADFGEASDIACEPIIVEDDGGNILWEA